MDQSEGTFAANMRALREDRGWSQGEVARRMVAAGWQNYSQMTVSRTEKNERPIRLSEARDLAAVFEVSLDEMTTPLRDRHVLMIDLQRKELDLLICAKRFAIAKQEAHGSLAAVYELLATIAAERPLSPPDVDAAVGARVDRLAEFADVLAAALESGDTSELPKYATEYLGERQAEA